MIIKNELIEIGKFNKPHGISGEISASFIYDSGDMQQLKCIILEMSGIFVPFFIDGYRNKNAHTSFLKISGINTEDDVKPLMGKPIFALKTDFKDIEEDEVEADNFIGFRIIDATYGEVGEIVAINDVTENYLFVLEDNKGDDIFIPITMDYITDIDEDEKKIYMNLPEGMLDV